MCARYHDSIGHLWREQLKYSVYVEVSLRTGQIVPLIVIVCDCEVVFRANPCRVVNHFDPLSVSHLLALPL